MYLPPQFKSDDPALAAAVMRAHPFATLVSNDDEGFPFATHLPLHLKEQDGGFVILGHVAKPNAHWRYLQARPQALAIFRGAHAYLSPKVYPDLQRVPTWNYLAVHCKVEATLIEDPDAKDQLLKTLIGEHEPAYAEQWRSLDGEFARKMLAGMVGFELKVTAWECKLKLNQHRRESHAAMRETYAAGNENERELAAWMDRLGMKGT